MNLKGVIILMNKYIKEYIRIWRSESTKDDYLFPNVADAPLTTNALKHAFAKYCGDRGVTRTNIHGLRHTFATQWIKAFLTVSFNFSTSTFEQIKVIIFDLPKIIYIVRSKPEISIKNPCLCYTGFHYII